MAFWQIKESGEYIAAQKEFVCDTADELSTIADSVSDALIIGDLATVIETGKKYMYSGSGEWVEQPSSGGGGSGGGGSDLPDVTSDDNGDVLTVVEGAWTNAAPSGGGGAQILFIDPTEYDSLTERQYVNKTFTEVASWLEAGGIAFMRRVESSGNITAIDYFVVCSVYGNPTEEAYEVVIGRITDEGSAYSKILTATTPNAYLSYPD